MGTAISIRDLGKEYHLGGGRSTYRTLRESLSDWMHRRTASADRSFWALREVSCDIAEGEVVGLIGGNGAGKSTLLRILARVTAPSTGTATLRGRVGSLLELGAGFHPELSGRENIHLAGTVLGMTRSEVRARFDAIVAFAEIDRHLDEPIKRYSSGMYLRLAFAVAAHLDCPILLVDEVLAVGDARFQQRCLHSMDAAARSGRTVVFVSHDLGAVGRLCNRTLWLRDGRIAGDGPTATVIGQYLADSSGAGLQAAVESARARCTDPAFTWLSVDILQDGAPVTVLRNGSATVIRIAYQVLQPQRGLRVYLDLLDEGGRILVRSLHDEREPEPALMVPGAYVSEVTIPADRLTDRPCHLVIQATIFDVRTVAPEISTRMDVVRTTTVNAAYPNEPLRGALLADLAWTTERTGP